MTQIIIGETDATLQPIERRYTREDGVTKLLAYEGPKKAVEELFNQYAAARASNVDNMTERRSHGKARLEVVTVDANGQTEDEAFWELVGEDVWVNLKAHPGISDEDAAELLAADRAIAEGKGEDSSWSTDVKGYYRLRRKGQNQFFSCVFTLRKTIVVGGNSALSATYTDTYRVVDLSSDIDPPVALFGTLTSLPIIGAGGTITYGAYEWLKKPPQIRSLGNNQYQLIYTWLGAQEWSAAIYGGTGSP